MMNRLSLSDLDPTSGNKPDMISPMLSNKTTTTKESDDSPPARKASIRKFDMSSELDVRLRDKVKYMSRMLTGRLKNKKTSGQLETETPHTVEEDDQKDDDSLLQSTSSTETILAPRSDDYTMYLEHQLSRKTEEVLNLKRIIEEQNQELLSHQEEKQREAVILREAAVLLKVTEKDRETLEVTLADITAKATKDFAVMEKKLADMHRESDFKTAFLTQEYQKVLVEQALTNKKLSENAVKLSNAHDEVSRLEAALKQNQKDYATLQCERDAAMDNVEELAIQLTTLQSVNSELQQQLESSTNLVHLCEAELTIVTADKSAALSRIDELTLELSSKTKQLDTAMTTVSELQSFAEHSNISLTSIAALPTVVSPSPSELELLQQQLDDAKNTLQLAEKSVTQLQASNTELRSDLSVSLTELSSALSQVETLRADVALHVTENQQLATLASDLESQLTSQRDANQRNEAEMETLRAELSTASSDVTSLQEITTTQTLQFGAETTTFQTQLSTSRQLTEALKSELTALHSKHAAALQELDKQRCEMSAMATEMTDLRVQLSSSQSTVGSIQAQMELEQAKHNEETAVLREELAVALKEKNQLSEHLAAIQHAIGALELQLVEQDKKYKSELAATTEQSATHVKETEETATKLQSQVVDLQSKLSVAESERSKACGEMSRLEGLLTASTQREVELAQHTEKLAHELETNKRHAQSQSEEAAGMITGLQTQIAELQLQLTVCENTTNSELARMTSEVTRLEGLVTAGAQRDSGKDKLIESLTEELEALKQQSESRKEESARAVEGLDAQITELRVALAGAESLAAKLTIERDRLTEEVSRLETAVSESNSCQSEQVEMIQALGAELTAAQQLAESQSIEAAATVSSIQSLLVEVQQQLTECERRLAVSDSVKASAEEEELRLNSLLVASTEREASHQQHVQSLNEEWSAATQLSETQLAELQATLDAARSDYTAANMDITRLTAEVTRLAGLVLTNFQQQESEKSQQIQALTAELTTVQQQSETRTKVSAGVIKGLQSQLADLQLKLSGAETRHDALSAELTHQSEEMTRLEAVIAAGCEQELEQKQQIETLTGELAAFKLQAESQSEESMSVIAGLQSEVLELQLKLTNTESKRDAVQIELEQALSEVIRLEAVVSEGKQREAEHLSQIQSLQNEVASVVQQSETSKMELENTVTSLQAQVMELQQRFSDSNDACALVNEKLTHATDGIARLEGVLSEHTHREAELNSQFTAITEELSTNKQLSATLAEDSLRTKTELERLTAEVLRLNSLVSDSNQRESALVPQLVSLQEELTALTMTSQSQSDESAHTVASLQSEIAELQLKQTESETTNTALRDELMRATTEVTRLEALLSACTQRETEIEQLLQTRDAELDTLKQQCKSQSLDGANTASELQAQVLNLEAKLTESERKLLTVDAELASTAKEVSRLESLLSQYSQKEAELNQRVVDLSDELTATKQQVVALTEEDAKATSEWQQQAAETEALRIELDETSVKLSRETEEVSRLDRLVSAAADRESDNAQKVDSLISELETVKLKAELKEEESASVVNGLQSELKTKQAEIDGVRAELSSVNQEVVRLDSALSVSAEREAEQSQRIESLTVELETVALAKVELTKAMSELQEQVTVCTAKLASTEEKHKQACDQIEVLNQAAATREQESSDLTLALDETKQDLATKTQLLVIQETALLASQGNLASVTVELAEKSSKCDELEASCGLFSQRLTDNKEELAQLRTHCEVLEGEAAAAAERRAELEEQLSEERETTSQHESETSAVRAVNAAMNKQLHEKSVECDASRAELVALQALMQAVEVELKETKDSFSAAILQVESLQNELRTGASHVFSSEAKADKLKEQFQLTQTELSESLQSNKALQDELTVKTAETEAHESTIAELQNVVTQLLSQEAILTDEVAELNKTYATLRVQYKTSQEAVCELRGDIQQRDEEAEDYKATIHELRSKIEDNLARLIAAQTEQDKTEAVVISLRSDLAAKEAELTAVQVTVSSLHHQLEAAKANGTNVESELADGKCRNVSLMEQVAALESKLQGCVSELEISQTAVQHLRQERTSTEVQLAAEREIHIALKSELETLQSELSELETAHTISLQQVESLNSVLTDNISELQQAKDSIDALSAEKDGLLSSVAALTESNNVHYQRMDALKEEHSVAIERLQSEVRAVEEVSKQAIAGTEQLLVDANSVNGTVQIKLNAANDPLAQSTLETESLRREIQEKAAVIETLQAEKTVHKETLSSVKAAQADAETQFAAAKAARDVEIHTLQHELAVTKQATEKVQQSLTEAERILVFLVGPQYCEFTVGESLEVPYVMHLQSGLTKLQQELDITTTHVTLMRSEEERRVREEHALRESITQSLSERTDDLDYLLSELIKAKMVCANLSYDLGVQNKRSACLRCGNLNSHNSSTSSLKSGIASRQASPVPHMSSGSFHGNTDSAHGSDPDSSSSGRTMKSTFSLFNLSEKRANAASAISRRNSQTNMTASSSTLLSPKKPKAMYPPTSPSFGTSPQAVSTGTSKHSQQSQQSQVHPQPQPHTRLRVITSSMYQLTDILNLSANDPTVAAPEEATHPSASATPKGRSSPYVKQSF